jgi:dTDP-4-dehydrorhamnose 3,5-epimerase
VREKTTNMEIIKTRFKDLYIIQPKVYQDDRGYFLETFSQRVFKKKTGLNIPFVQDNESKSKRGVLRGLHYQMGDTAQSKLVRAIDGVILDVVLDMRPYSDTFGETFEIILNSKDKNQLFIPKGFAHGFVALEDDSVFAYKCDEFYYPEFEAGVNALDPELAIDWQIPMKDLIRSDKDKNEESWDIVKKRIIRFA